MEASSAEFLKRAAACPSDLSVWTKLYAASQTMLSAVRTQRVVPALTEICANLVGCEELAIVEIERGSNGVHFLSAEGLTPAHREVLIQNARQLESQIDPGNVRILVAEEGDPDNLGSLGISALVPLWKDERSSCAMLLFQLLPQRNGFDAEDREILQLLTIYAGPCLRSQKRG